MSDVLVSADAGAFRCTGCGSCCSQVWVNVTDADVKRLARHTGLSAPEIVQFVAPTIVDADNEDEDGWVPFGPDPADRGLMVLKIQRSSGACRFLEAELCTVYEARPRACRLYPWEFDDADEEIVIDVVTDPCPWERDGTLDVVSLLEQIDLDEEERDDYEEAIVEWIESGSPDDPLLFLRFLGLPTRHSTLGLSAEERGERERKSRLRSFLRVVS